MAICTLGRVKWADCGSRDRTANSTTAPTVRPIRNPPDKNAANCSTGRGRFSITTVIPRRNGSRLTATAITSRVIHISGVS